MLQNLVTALRCRDADERADLLGAAIDAGTAAHFSALAAAATGDEIMALCLLARSFSKQVPLAEVTGWLAHEAPHIRAAVIQSIAFRPVDSGVLRVISHGVADETASVRIATIRAARHNGDPTLLALLEPLRADDDAGVRRWLAAK
ncbi:MAG: hypothetical protein KC502_12535 [Myxococcales bacterium]|nr:hypothetical protein [Myxococcales bacterium]